MKAESDNFSKAVSLFLNIQKVSLLIQLNKPIFRTDDLIEFRVFAVDSQTNPYAIKDTSKIRILDPNNYEAKVWTNPSFSMGLFEGDLKLFGAEPGVWKILAQVDGEVRDV